ncbi:MAG: O-antigen ligase family protein [Aggregatilineales bacterium]
MTTKTASFSGAFKRRRPIFDSTQSRLVRAALIALGCAVVLVGAVIIGSRPASGATFIVLMYAVLIGGLIAVRPIVGVYILAAFVYLNLSDILQVDYGIQSINKVLVGLVFVSILANRLVFLKKPFIFRRTELLLLIYFMILLFSVFVADDRSSAFTGAVDSLKDFVIILIIIQMCDNEQAWRNLLWTILLSAALVASLSAYQMLTKDFNNTFFGLANAPVHQITSGFDSNRVTGPLSDPNYYGQILLMVLPIGLYGVLTERRRLFRFIYLGASLAIMAATVFTYSRGSLIALVVVGILIVRERKLDPYKIVAGGVVILAILLPILPPGYLDRVMTLSDVLPQNLAMQTEVSFKGRSSEMIIAVQMFADHPIFGVGYLNYQFHYANYNALLGLDPRAGEREAHDLYLEILAETGIIGFLSFIGILVAVFAGIQRAKRQFRNLHREDLIAPISAVEYGLVSYLATSLFLHGAYVRYLWLLVAMALGGMVLAETLIRQRREALRATEDGLYYSHELITVGPQV